MSEWHAVEEGLPEEDAYVLVRVSGGAGYRATLTVSRWQQRKDGPAWVTPGHVRDGGRRVTHWRACLPDPLDVPGWTRDITIAGEEER